MALHKVQGLGDLARGQGRIVDVAGKQLAMFNVDGNYHAIDNTCPHRGGPLGDGMLNGTTVTCPWHGWQFDCKTGQSTMNPTMGVPSFTVTTEGDSVMVEL